MNILRDFTQLLNPFLYEYVIITVKYKMMCSDVERVKCKPVSIVSLL